MNSFGRAGARSQAVGFCICLACRVIMMMIITDVHSSKAIKAITKCFFASCERSLQLARMLIVFEGVQQLLGCLFTDWYLYFQFLLVIRMWNIDRMNDWQSHPWHFDAQCPPYHCIDERQLASDTRTCELTCGILYCNEYIMYSEP
ncbi:hypothetical protein BXZ70DRAFT_961356 [Cristinia sonorae]|uniref:Uncharacterized protein n=1 Tax=Cristinia sonorae TaxID=1940300 RepID=A0A8K0UG40_9AGAR|nr:hypothetical protein BXZ70DRAFT_961356 [Cristinia sonorae]